MHCKSGEKMTLMFIIEVTKIEGSKGLYYIILKYLIIRRLLCRGLQNNKFPVILNFKKRFKKY